MRASLFLVAVLAVCGCDRGARAELEQKNAQLAQEKAALELELARVRAELAKAEQAGGAPSTPGAPLPPSDEQSLQEAQDAYVRGEYTKAIRLAKKTIASSPAKSWRIVGAANCFLHDSDGARDAYDHLGGQERAFLRYVCTRNNVKID